MDLNSTRPQKAITTLPVCTFKEFKEFSFINDTEEKRRDNTQVRCLLTARAEGGAHRPPRKGRMGTVRGAPPSFPSPASLSIVHLVAFQNTTHEWCMNRGNILPARHQFNYANLSSSLWRESAPSRAALCPHAVIGRRGSWPSVDWLNPDHKPLPP